jgi:hypothetical protein
VINLSRVLNNPRFRQTFYVYRSVGHFGRGGWVEETQNPASFAVVGMVWPSTEREVEQVPEADRATGMVTFASVEELYITRSSETAPGTSDKIQWRGDMYRLVGLMPWNDYGFNVVVGVRMKGA